MTYKQALAEILGENHAVFSAEKFVGGVYMCPEDAFHGAERHCCLFLPQEESCAACWGHEYQGEEYNENYLENEEEWK